MGVVGERWEEGEGGGVRKGVRFVGCLGGGGGGRCVRIVDMGVVRGV